MPRTLFQTGPAGRRPYRSRLNRRQSPLRMRVVPAISVVLGSMVPMLFPLFPAWPLIPPVGLMLFVAWILLRPGIWPVWAGFLFGLADDVMSGQPIGSAALLWSLIILLVHLIDRRMTWRDYLQDWLIASLLFIFAIAGAWLILGFAHPRPSLLVLVPQMIVSILIFPVIVRLTAALDRWRLAR